MGRSTEVARTCLRILRQDKEIILLPLMAAASIFVVIIVYIASIFVSPALLFSLLLVIPILLVVIPFLGVFFQAAVVGMAKIRLEGGDPRVRDGLRMAARCAWPLLQWAMVTIIVGIILGIIRAKLRPQNRIGPTFGPSFSPQTNQVQSTSYPAHSRSVSSSFAGGLPPLGPAWGIGDIITGALEMAWGAATFFVIPIIIYEKMSPLRAVSRSFQIVKHLWKETLILNLGFGAIFALVGLLGIVFIGAGVATAGISFIPNPAGSSTLNGVSGDTIITNPSALIAGLVAAGAYWAILGATHSSLKGILRGTLYTYSSKDQVQLTGPDHFNPLKSLIKSLRGEEEMKKLSEAPQPAPSAADEIEKLAELRERGIITDEEFQDKKRKLLEKI